MKRALVCLALGLALVSTGCNSCRPRLFSGSWFNSGDCCDSGGGMMSSAGSHECTNCSSHVTSGEWVPATSSSAGYGYVPEEIPNPTRIGPQG